MREPWDLNDGYIKATLQSAENARSTADNVLVRMIAAQLGRQDAATQQQYGLDTLAQRNVYATQADSVAFDRQLQRDNTAYQYKDADYARQRADTLADRTANNEQKVIEQRMLAEREAAARGEISAFGPRRYNSAAAPAGNGDLTLATIKKFEGFRPDPYWDVNALRTGYGSDTITTADGRVVRVDKNTRVTREDADRDLGRRAKEFEGVAVRQVGPEAWQRLPEGARAALTSMTYNYGSLPRSVAAAVQSGDIRAIAQAVASRAVDNDGVNKNRRLQEAAMINGDTSGIDTSSNPRRYGADTPTGQSQSYADTVLFGEVPNRAPTSVWNAPVNISEPMRRELDAQGLEPIRRITMTEAAMKMIPPEMMKQFVYDPFSPKADPRSQSAEYIQVQPKAITDPNMKPLPGSNVTKGPSVEVQKTENRRYEDGKKIVLRDGKELVLPD